MVRLEYRYLMLKERYGFESRLTNSKNIDTGRPMKDRLRGWHPESHGKDDDDYDVDIAARDFLNKKHARRKNLETIMQNKHPEILAYIKEYCRMK
jgi:hypothetical protein